MCPPSLFFAIEFLLYAFLAAFSLHASWLTWPDAFVDFSRELYHPWRIACGDILYRDLAYDFGPLSVYANAALFTLLGRPSIHALFALNFLVWVAILLALRALLRRLAHPLVATICIFLFILLFSFNRYMFGGNFNYLAPYSHELPRGFLLALLSLLSLASAVQRCSSHLFLLSGLFLGLSLFTKPEIALAAVSASAVLFLVRLLSERGHRAHDGGTGAKPASQPSRPFALFILHFSLHAAGAFCAVGLVLIPLALVLGSFSLAFREGLLKLYTDCVNPALSALPFYRVLMGLDAPLPHTLRLLGGTLLAVGPILLVSLVDRLPSRPFRLTATVLLALAALAIGIRGVGFLNAALPLAPLLFFILSFFPWIRHHPDRNGGVGATLPSFSPPSPIFSPFPLAPAFAVFSFVLVSKMFLNASIGSYGFVLALPAFCCAIILLFRFPCPVPRTAIALALIAGFSFTAYRLHFFTLRKWEITHPIHRGAFLSDPLDAKAFDNALGWICSNTPPDSTLAVLPEGAILNVLSARPNPTPYVYLSHGDWLRFGADAVLSAYTAATPDTLVLVRKPQTAQFGLDYAKDLLAFLSPLYTPALTVYDSTPAGPVPYLLVAVRTTPHRSRTLGSSINGRSASASSSAAPSSRPAPPTAKTPSAASSPSPSAPPPTPSDPSLFPPHNPSSRPNGTIASKYPSASTPGDNRPS